MMQLLPSEVEYQDLDGFIARQPPVVDRTQKAAFASPFGTIHEAKLVLPRPIGASMPPSLDYALAALDPSNVEVTGSVRERILGEDATLAGPVFDRSRKSDYGSFGSGKSERSAGLKGDRLAPVAPLAQDEAPQREPQMIARRDSEPQIGPPLSLA